MVQILVTGASGALGTTLVPKLVAAGHTVTGLGRSDASITKIQSLASGIKAIKGDITDLDICTKAAAEADIVIHLAFDHQQAFSGDFVGACKKDKAVTEAICNGMTQSGNAKGKLFMFASGTLGLTAPSETSEPHRSPHLPRYEAGDLAATYTSKGLHVVCLRLAPITYSEEKPHDFINMQIAAAKSSGYVAYADNHAWSACSYDDCAECITLAVKAADKLPNPVNLHLIAEEGVPHKLVAETLAKKIGSSAKRIEEAELAPMGFLGMLLSLAKPATAEYTKQVTGWQPKAAGLIAQLKTYEFEQAMFE